MAFNKNLLQPCPILCPNEREFEDPISFLSRPDIAKLGSEYGIVKVVPPPGWKPMFLLSPEFKFHTRLQKLSDLGLKTRSRKFFTDNINRFLKMRRKKQVKPYFYVKSPNLQDRRNKIYYYDLYVAVENMGGIDEMTKEKWFEVIDLFRLDRNSTELEDEYFLNIKSYAIFLSQNSNNFEFPDSDSEEHSENCLVCGKRNKPSLILLCDNCDNAYHMTCLDPALPEVPSGNWYCDKCLIGTGEYGFEEPTNIKYTIPEFYGMCQNFEEDFMKEYNNGFPLSIDFIEQKFWEFVDVQKSDLEVKYGADIHNLIPGQISGFPMANTPNINQEDAEVRKYINHPFNLTKLPFAKGSLLNYINTSISGMTVPWIYIGSLLSTFCWHVEDHYTLSANYCHFGATKKWYGIPSYDADKFEKLMKESAPDLFKRQPDLLHQLVTLLSPMTLVENGIKCVYADQNPNEFIITYPRVYHSGFNTGFNLNEAVNFAMDNWLEYGEKSIDDYRLIKKENVFNHYQLIENILKGFNKKSGRILGRDLELVKKSITYFEKFVNKQNNILSKFDTSKFEVKFQPKAFERRNFELEELGKFDDDDDDDKDLCEICRTHIAYQYCIINNEERNFHLSREIKNKAVKYPKKITIDQLLTPEASPQIAITVKEEKLFELATKASEKLQLLNDLKEEPPLKRAKISVMEQFDKLILELKEIAKTGSNDASSRRRSRRLTRAPQDQEVLSSPPALPPQNINRMSDANHCSLSRYLNLLDSFNLCLECCAQHCGADSSLLPDGSTLLYEVFPSQLKKFVNETKQNLIEIALM